MKRPSHLRGFLVLLGACLWVTTAVFAEHVSAEFPFCQPERSPCCPQPTNNTGGSCVACSISGTVAVKSSREQERAGFVPRTYAGREDRPGPPVSVSCRELTAGLRYQRIVFDLKDDLRI